ncbi:MAG: MATE family efflux transporter [Eubacteriales bacterium]|nr:MATE family efflux transporter [Eubacteriales bacterium]
MDITNTTSRNKTLFQYVAPAVLTNACVFLFTIIDGIFVGRGVGSDALSAVNIAMPLVMIATAINMLTSIGGVTVAAIRLGRGEKEGANPAFMHSLTANLILAALMTILCVFFTEPVAQALGAQAQYIQMPKEYIFWWGLFAIPCALSVNFQSFCRNDGSPGLVGTATVISTVLNIFLDWLFVFPLHMGIRGAALATGLSQTVSMLIVLMHFLLKKGDLRIRPFKPDAKLYRKVLFRGLPEMIAQFATPVTTICMNHVLMAQLGDIGINAFSIISYVSSLTMSVLAGASEGLQPLFGQSYGAKKEKDLKYYFRSGIVICLVGSALIVLLAILLATPICTIFGASGQTLEFTVQHLPQYAWAFIVAGINTLISAYLYSTKRSAYAIALNIVRSLVLNTIIILGLPAVFGSGIVWFTFGISECLVMVLAVILLKASEKNGIVYK